MARSVETKLCVRKKESGAQMSGYIFGGPLLDGDMVKRKSTNPSKSPHPTLLATPFMASSHARRPYPPPTAVAAHPSTRAPAAMASS